MKKLPRAFWTTSISNWVIATCVTAALGTTAQTQIVIHKLNLIGGDISISQRFEMTLYDFIHLGPLYALFIALAFIASFLAAGLVFYILKFGHVIKFKRTLIYTVAGGVAIWVMLFLMKAQFFDTHIIAGARDGFGIGLQVLAGMAGGFIFARLSPRPT